MKLKLSYILELISAMLLLILLFPIGIIYSLIIQPFINFKKYNVFKYFWNFIYSIIAVILCTFHQIAYYIDVLGNVVIGNLIEIIIIKDKSIIDTWFGKKEHSISQATGQLEVNNQLNKIGIWFSKALSFVFEEGHCINAYNEHKEEKL